MRQKITKTKRLVVKVGSALVTNNGAGLSEAFIANCASQIAALHLLSLDADAATSGRPDGVAVRCRDPGPASNRQ